MKTVLLRILEILLIGVLLFCILGLIASISEPSMGIAGIIVFGICCVICLLLFRLVHNKRTKNINVTTKKGSFFKKKLLKIPVWAWLIVLFAAIGAASNNDSITNTNGSTNTVAEDHTTVPTENAIAMVTVTATISPEPTVSPTTEPTSTPTVKPTATPTAKPTTKPTAKPTTKPTATPTTKTVTYTYVYNKNTKKFHYSWCSSADDIKEKNRGTYTGTRNEMINKGYDPCKRCNP